MAEKMICDEDNLSNQSENVNNDKLELETQADSQHSGSSMHLKRKISKELFPDKGKKIFKAEDKAIVSSFAPSFTSLPKLALSEITSTNLRFAFEGKVLNKYGTYDSDPKRDFKKYLKADLADEVGFGTITLVVESEFIKKNLEKINVGSYIRVEGAVVCAKNPNDGGTVDHSLHVDATTCILCAEPFETTLFFVPEISIRSFLLKVQKNPSLKGTIAFVIIQIDKVDKSEGVIEQLTIADGPSSLDRATLTFVNKRKVDYNNLVSEFQSGNIVPYVARNVGAWKGRSNTLSILDITLLCPLYVERRKKELEDAFRVQISEMGYGKEVHGSLQITNFNGVLVVKKCALCKGFKVSTLPEGGFCYLCGKVVAIHEVVKLEGEISQAGEVLVEVSLTGDAVDKVLRLEDTFLNLYHLDSMKVRISLSENTIEGSFLVDNQGQIIGFKSSSANPN